MSERTLLKILNSTIFSVVVLMILLTALSVVAYVVTKSYEQEPDFGGMITIRQTQTDADSPEQVRLSREMLRNFITEEKILAPIAARNNWDVSRKQMLENIDVKPRVTSPGSFTIFVNTGVAERSGKIAEALTNTFLEDYRRKWETRNRKYLGVCGKRITAIEGDLRRLRDMKTSLALGDSVNPVNTELEMRAINDQLVEAQRQFFTAYTTYMSSITTKYTDLEIEYNTALASGTAQDPMVRLLKKKLTVMKKFCDDTREKLMRQKPDVYSLRQTKVSLDDLPADIVFFYENIQALQKIKLGMLLPSIITEKEKELEREMKKKAVLEHLLASHSCDVFIRETGR